MAWALAVRRALAAGGRSAAGAPRARRRLLATGAAAPARGGGKGEQVQVTFVAADGASERVKAKLGSSFLQIAHDNDIEVEGACGGEMACSTCHMIFDKKTYDSLPKKEEEEEDMLDLALGLTDTSRLGCQVICTAQMDGITIRLPKETSNQKK